MFKSFKIDLKIVALIVLPLVLAAVSLTSNTFAMLEKIAVGVNQQERLRSIQAAQSAIYSLQTSLEGIVTDNAHWDEAAANTNDPVVKTWLTDNWGVSSSDPNYDTVFMVDQKGQTIFGFKDGTHFNKTAKEHLGSVLNSALSAMPQDKSVFYVTSSLIKVPDGIATLAIAPILPGSAKQMPKEYDPKYLIFLKTISSSTVTTLGQNFILHDLMLAPYSPSDDGGQIVPSRWGQPIAKLYWTENNPGKAARDANIPSAWLSIFALIMVMSPLAFVHFRTLATIDRNEKKSFREARHDALSGLPNRVLLLEEITQRMPMCHLQNGEMALAFIDLDGFKAVNDAHGHEIGDELIKVVAIGLNKISEGKFMVTRLGGDEFAVLFVGQNALAEIERFAEKIPAALAQPFDIGGCAVGIGASVGIAQCIDPKMEVSEFMRQADIAMYDAKENGRNCWRRFNPTLDADRCEELNTVNEMRQLLANDLMEVAYQPFVSSSDQKILGVEALARWPLNATRKVDPVYFIRLAEQHGLIDKLGMAILRKACFDMAQWSDLKVAINFSPMQIKRLTLVKEIKAIADELKFDLNRLEVEFTEAVLIQNPDRAKIVIDELQALGVKVALDDFGTGYASLGYLHRFAFDKIKIDRSLTQTLSRGSMTQNIVQGTVLIAKGLSADVIAEGVETEDDAKLMRLAGCELLQGYYFGKPQSAEVLNDLLNGHPKASKSVSA